MSVLYKALARAAKARASSGGDAGGASGEVASAGSRRRRRWPIILVALILLGAGGYFFAGDVFSSLMDTVQVIIFGEPAPPPPSVVRPKPKPPAQTAANQPSAGPGPAMAPNPATPGTPPATAATQPPPAAPGAPAGMAQPPAPVGAPVAPAMAAPVTPPAAAAPGQATAPTTAPTPAGAALSPAMTATPAPNETGAEPAAPAASSRKGQLTQTASSAPAPAAKAAPVTPEADLPAILDRIRRERTKSTIEPGAVVDRGTAAAPATASAAGTTGDAMISVSAAPATDRDATERAYDMLLHGQYEGALELYDSVLRNTPKSLAALIGKATALHKLRRLAEARGFYQKVLAIDPNNREALTNMMAIIAAQSPEAALAELRDMQRSYPVFSPIPAEIASIEAQSGDAGDAISELNRAIQLSPDNGLYRLNLAVLQDRAGMAQEAAASYQSALDLLASGAQLPMPMETIRARLRYLRSR